MLKSVRYALIFVVIFGLLSGCASWDTPDDTPTKIPRARLSKDSVVLQVRLVNRLDSTSGDLTPLWNELDEQHIDRALRRHLDANGFRCGILGIQMPEVLGELLNSTESSTDKQQPDSFIAASELENSVRRLHARARRPYPIVTSPTRERMVVLTHEGGMSGGDTFHQAHCRFSLRSYPLGDGRVRLELVPEIHHGPLRQKYTGSQGAIRAVVGRDQQVYEELRIDTVLSPGETLVVTTGDQPKGLGRQFFVDESEIGDKHLILLVRLAHTQIDDLFQETPMSTPLATTSAD